MQTEPTLLLDNLIAKRPGNGVRAISVVMRGVRNVSNQVPPYTEWWSDRNHRIVEQLRAARGQSDTTGTEPASRLLVSIGDSSALGIGAKDPALSYIGQLTDLLNEPGNHIESAPQWSAINLSMSGARVRDGLDQQLPQLELLNNAELTPDLVVCCIGSNDVFWGSGRRRQSATQRNAVLRDELSELIAALPATAIVGDCAGRSERAHLANQAIRTACDARGMTRINPWKGDGGDGRPRLSEDRFHLNELGYAAMAEAFAEAIVAMPPPTDAP